MMSSTFDIFYCWVCYFIFKIKNQILIYLNSQIEYFHTAHCFNWNLFVFKLEKIRVLTIFNIIFFRLFLIIILFLYQVPQVRLLPSQITNYHYLAPLYGIIHKTLLLFSCYWSKLISQVFLYLLNVPNQVDPYFKIILLL